MGDDMNLVPLTFPSIYSPILDKLEANNDAAAQTLRTALSNAEKLNPGILFELTRQLLSKAALEINYQEAYLKQQGELLNSDFALPGGNPLYTELSHRAVNLRKILSRIPMEIADRRQFLETIKEIASSIKKLLDATNALIPEIQGQANHTVEMRKREFVKYSKRFSNTLKEYFKGQDRNLVYQSANQLIFQTGQIVKTVRNVAAN